MPNIKTFPKSISVKINTDSGPGEHFLSADTDPLGMSFAEEGERIKVAVYKLDHVREVTLIAESIPLTKPR